MHYTTSYKGCFSRELADDMAIGDIKEYLTPQQWTALLELARQVNNGETGFPSINFGLSIAGVSGYPFHAFSRHFCLLAYREWMHTGDDAVMTDSAGFALEPAS
jgi:hypothetical protein